MNGKLGDWYRRTGPDWGLLEWVLLQPAHRMCVYSIKSAARHPGCIFRGCVSGEWPRLSVRVTLQTPVGSDYLYLYWDVITEVDYIQQQNLISKPLRNAETFGLKFPGKAYSKHENDQRALHFKLQLRCVFLIK